MGMAADMDKFADAALLQSLEYWQHLRGGRRMPARKDLNPADIPRLLPKLMLADVRRVASETQAPRICFRLVGTEIVGRFGYELTGRDLTDIDYGEQTDHVASLYRRAVDCAQPQFTQIEFSPSRNRILQMQHLLLPLSDDDTNVNMILAVLHCP